MKVLGIDPGYERLGIAVIEKASGGKEALLFSDCLKTSSKNNFYARIFFLAEEIEKIIFKYKPEILAIEKLFFTTNQKTAMAVSEVKGVCGYLALKNGMEIVEITPLQVKQSIVGYGKADKRQVALMTGQLLKIDDKKRPDDEYDAIALALTGLVLFRAYQKSIFPQTTACKK